MDSVKVFRVAVAGVVVSASALVGIAERENYTDQAVIPVPGDVPTFGYGTTRTNGQPVKLGDRTTPPKAMRIKVLPVAFAMD